VTEPWGTYHNPRALKDAWRVAIIGGPMALGWVLIAMLAPVKVPVVQALAFMTALLVGTAIVRLGVERICTDQGGVTVYPAFRKSFYIAWPNLASLDTKTIRSLSPDNSGIEDLAAALFDLDTQDDAFEISQLILVTRRGGRHKVPIADEYARDLIESGWREYSSKFGRRLFFD